MAAVEAWNSVLEHLDAPRLDPVRVADQYAIEQRFPAVCLDCYWEPNADPPPDGLWVPTDYGVVYFDWSPNPVGGGPANHVSAAKEESPPGLGDGWVASEGYYVELPDVTSPF